MGSCVNPLDTLFLHPVFALGKLLAPINVDSFGVLSSPGFDIGEVLLDEMCGWSGKIRGKGVYKMSLESLRSVDH